MTGVDRFWYVLISGILYAKHSCLLQNKKSRPCDNRFSLSLCWIRSSSMILLRGFVYQACTKYLVDRIIYLAEIRNNNNKIFNKFVCHKVFSVKNDTGNKKKKRNFFNYYYLFFLKKKRKIDCIYLCAKTFCMQWQYSLLRFIIKYVVNVDGLWSILYNIKYVNICDWFLVLEHMFRCPAY